MTSSNTDSPYCINVDVGYARDGKSKYTTFKHVELLEGTKLEVIEYKIAFNDVFGLSKSIKLEVKLVPINN